MLYKECYIRERILYTVLFKFICRCFEKCGGKERAVEFSFVGQPEKGRKRGCRSGAGKALRPSFLSPLTLWKMVFIFENFVINCFGRITYEPENQSDKEIHGRSRIAYCSQMGKGQTRM